MDGTSALVLVSFILSVLALVLTFVFVGVAAYVLWRYVVIPWRVMRSDVTVLHGEVKSLAAQVQRAQVLAHDDAEIARIEARVNARQRARATQEGLR